MTMHGSVRLLLVPVALLSWSLTGSGQTPGAISTEAFSGEVTGFLTREISAHAAEVKSLDPPQATVFGARTTGDFNWGTYMRAVAEWSALTGQGTLDGKDVATYLGKVGLIDAKGGAKTFSQWYGALTLQHFGPDLKTNRLWQSLAPGEQELWRQLLDPGRFYDRQTRRVINLPENYFGVAARIAAVDYQLGLADRGFADDVLSRAADQFVKGALYTDDDLPHGRYDRYSQEYARSVYEVALMMGRQEIVAAVEPALQQDMKTWWAVVSRDGYSFSWGRTLGVVSYMDTLDIIGFLARYPQFRPAPLPQLASLYYAAFEALKRDVQPDRHLLGIWEFGRGNYKYMANREWQATSQFLGKAAASFGLLRAALAKEGVASFSAVPDLPEVNRFDWFRKGDRPAGVWLVRGQRLRFDLPFTTGTVSGIDDYLPAPHSLPGFAAPVEQNLPAMVPYLELANGQTIVAGDCADRIDPAADGKSLRALWKRWVAVGAQAGQFADFGLQSEVLWKLDGDALVRTEKITASRPVEIRHWTVMVPTTASRVATRWEAGQRIDRLLTPDGPVDVTVLSAEIPLAALLTATGNQAAGKGGRGAIPLILQFEARDLAMKAGESRSWTMRWQVLGKSRE